MIKNLELHVIKQIEFTKEDSDSCNVVLRYITQSKTHLIIDYQVFIKNDCINDSEVFNFANIYYDMFNTNKTIEHEVDIIDTFNRYLNINGKWSMKKVKPKFNQERGKILTYPYLYFSRFESKLKKQWFEKQYKENNIKIGEYINE